MYTIVKVSVFDDVLQWITVGFGGKFSFLEDFFRILQMPPLPSQTEKTQQGRVYVVKPWDSPDKIAGIWPREKLIGKSKTFYEGILLFV